MSDERREAIRAVEWAERSARANPTFRHEADALHRAAALLQADSIPTQTVRDAIADVRSRYHYRTELKFALTMSDGANNALDDLLRALGLEETDE